MSLAIFDLDNTLLNGDSDYAWGQFLVEQHIIDGEEYERKNQHYYDAYKKGTLDIMEFLAFSLRPLAELDRNQLDQWHARFMREKIKSMITPAAQQLVADHRDQGDSLVIITATNSFITRPIAEQFGVTNLIATEPEEIDGQFTGKVVGTPCFREGKVERLQQWLDENNESLEDSWFYSDSHNDLPLLDRVTHPVAVNPDPTLKYHAEKKGWSVVTLD